MTDNQTIAEAMGIHWHEGIVRPDGSRSIYKCSCMEYQSLEPLHFIDPPVFARTLAEWLRRRA